MRQSSLLSILGAINWACVGMCIVGPPGYLFTVLCPIGGFIGTLCLKSALAAKAGESQPRA